MVCTITMSSNNTFSLDVTQTTSVGPSAISDETILWHLRYGHLNERSLHDLSSKGMVHGLRTMEHLSVCEGCVEGKKACEAFPGYSSRTTQILDLVHTDVCGSMPVQSLGGNKLFLLFTDDLSRMT